MPVKVRILRRRVINVELFEETKRVVRILYQAEGLPPRVIWVDEDKATEENVKKLIALDLRYNIGITDAEVEIVE